MTTFNFYLLQFPGLELSTSLWPFLGILQSWNDRMVYSRH